MTLLDALIHSHNSPTLSHCLYIFSECKEDGPIKGSTSTVILLQFTNDTVRQLYGTGRVEEAVSEGTD